uniref:Uncharacterized protein n=1 Tax=Gopherus agassizii TaxID=38772 RepID=A0A452II81_9SAUR
MAMQGSLQLVAMLCCGWAQGGRAQAPCCRLWDRSMGPPPLVRSSCTPTPWLPTPTRQRTCHEDGESCLHGLAHEVIQGEHPVRLDLVLP